MQKLPVLDLSHLVALLNLVLQLFVNCLLCLPCVINTEPKVIRQPTFLRHDNNYMIATI